MQSKVIKVYSPYWLAIARCPPLTFRLVNFGGKSPTRKIPFPFKSKKSGEVILEDITDEELCEGHTIASALNFKLLGLSASASQSGEEHFGPVKDLSPLNDMVDYIDCGYFFAFKLPLRTFILIVVTFFPSSFVGWICGPVCLQ